jgi:hypothetical protein
MVAVKGKRDELLATGDWTEQAQATNSWTRMDGRVRLSGRWTEKAPKRNCDGYRRLDEMDEQGTQQNIADLMAKLSGKREPVGWGWAWLVDVSDLRQSDPSVFYDSSSRFPNGKPNNGSGPGMRTRI